MRRPFDATGTIGSRPCEISLNKILAEKGDPKLIHSITLLLHKCKAGLRALKALPDRRDRKYFVGLMREQLEQRLAKITGVQVRGVPVTDIVASHTMCCLAAYYRDFDERPVAATTDDV